MQTSWLSYHVYSEGDLEAFATGTLAPALDRLEREGHLKRFFFIRYSDGGPHLRLRLSPRRELARETVDGWVAGWVDRFNERGADLPSRLEMARYDREAHYFGDNTDSVYAELLNVATSRLALGLLIQWEGASLENRRIITLLILQYLSKSICPEPDRRQRLLDASIAFAARAFKDATGNDLSPVFAREGIVEKQLEHAGAAMAPLLAKEPSVAAVVGLGRRILRNPQRQAFVLTHALHLLCNKLGFGLADEHLFFSLMREES